MNGYAGFPKGFSDSPQGRHGNRKNPYLRSMIRPSLCFVALTATLWIAGADLFRWLDRAPEQYHAFWPKRVGYTLATHIDLPLVQGMIAGLVAFGTGRRRWDCCVPHPVAD